MSEPRRPDPIPSRREKLRSVIDRARERLRAGRAPSVLDPLAPEPGGPSAAVTLALGVASVAVALAGVWAWQTWSQRSSEPIDDLIPLLVAPETVDPEPTTARAADDVADPGASVAESLEAVPEEAVGAPTPGVPVEIIVHVSGAVDLPGVVVLTSGDRVVDAVAAAGGATVEADLARVNLASVVGDGEHVHVPVIDEAMPVEVMPSSVVNRDDGEAGALAPVDINLATADELESLPGVGPAIAAAIVQTRIDRGPFLTVEELLDVPGIGETKLATLTPHVFVG